MAAGDIGSLYVTLGLNAKRFRDGMSATQSFTDGWAKKTGSAIATGLSAGVVAGTAAATGALIGLGKMAFSTANQFAAANRQITTQLGLVGEEAEAVGRVVEGVYGNNFGDSIEDAAQQVITMEQALSRLGDVSESELQLATEHAIALKDAFGLDVAGSADAAATLMDNFGVSGQEAFDIITWGMQNGLNASGDFLDSISEYSTQFSGLGFEAEEFLGIMASGLDGATLGTDKIADAIKEMGIFLIEGKKETVEALGDMGFSYEAWSEQVRMGNREWSDYFPSILKGLKSIEDPMRQQTAAVALFGTMGEDLGPGFVESLEAIGISMEELEGSTDKLNVQYENLPAALEGLRRQARLALKPIGDQMLRLTSKLIPLLTDGLERVSNFIGPIFERAQDPVNGFLEAMKLLRDGIGYYLVGALEDGGEQLSEMIAMLTWMVTGKANESGGFADRMAGAIFRMNDKLEVALEFFGKLKRFFEPLVIGFRNLVSGAINWQDAAMGLAYVLGAFLLPVIAPIALAVAAFVGVFMGVTAVISFVRQMWENDFAGIRNFASGVWAAIMAGVAAFKALFSGDWEGFLENIKTGFSTAWTTAIEFLGGLWDLAQPYLIEWWDAIVAWVEETDWKGLLENSGEYIASGLENLWTELEPKFTAMLEEATAWFESIDWGELGRSLMSSLGESLSELWTNLQPGFSGMKESAIAWIDEQDWYTLGYTIATRILEGLTWLALGFVGMIGSIIEWAWNGGIPELFGDVGAWWGESIFKAIWDAWEEFKTGLIQAIIDFFGVDFWTAASAGIFGNMPSFGGRNEQNVQTRESGFRQVWDNIMGFDQGGAAELIDINSSPNVVTADFTGYQWENTPNQTPYGEQYQPQTDNRQYTINLGVTGGVNQNDVARIIVDEIDRQGGN